MSLNILQSKFSDEGKGGVFLAVEDFESFALHVFGKENGQRKEAGIGSGFFLMFENRIKKHCVRDSFNQIK